MIIINGKPYDKAYVWEQAKLQNNRLCGYYNQNYLTDLDGYKVVVRKPMTSPDDMDLLFPCEQEVLQLLQEHDLNVPVFYGDAPEYGFFVESFIDGDVLNNTHPRGSLVPNHFIDDYVRLNKILWNLDYTPLLQNFPAGWPIGNNVGEFFEKVLGKVESIWSRYKNSYAELYRYFGSPENPLEIFQEVASLMAKRPMVLAHADMHRKNVIIKDAQTWFLDWECALIADPVYDMAVHIHRMYYTHEEKKRFIDAVKHHVDNRFTNHLERDLERYLMLERVKSFIVDVVRTHQHLINPNEDKSVQDYVVNQMVRKIAQVNEIWGGRHYSVDEIRDKMLSFSPE